MRKMRRGVSLLLSIVLVLGAVPLGSRAAECQHKLAYTAEDNCITAACGNEGCDYSATAKLEPDPEVSTAYTGKEIKPLKIVYSENWQGEKTETITYVNNIAVAELEQEKEETPQPVSEDPQEEAPSDTENQPEGEKEQNTEKRKEEKKIPSGTLTIGGVSVTRTFAIGKGELTVTATGSAAYGDEAPQYTLVCKDTEGNPVEGVITAAPEMMTSDYTPEAKAGTTFEIRVNLGDITSENYEFKTENGSFTVSPREVTLSVNNPDYDGQLHTAEITVGNLVGDDKLEAVHVEMPQTDAGDYKIAVDALKAVDGNGADLNNYKLPDNAEVTFTIKPREVTLSTDKTEYLYDGESHAPKITVGNLIGKDVLEADYEEATLTAADTYEILIKDLKGEEAVRKNYKLPDNAKVSFAIKPRVVEVEWGTQTFDYSEEGYSPNPKIKNLVEGDEVTLKPMTEIPLKTAGTHEIQFELDGKDKDNYIIPKQDAKVTFTIQRTSKNVSATGEEDEKTPEIILPTDQTGYTITTEKTEAGTKITFLLNEGYIQKDFAVKVNGEKVNLDAQGSHTVLGTPEKIEIDVEGVYPLVVAIKFGGETFLAVEEIDPEKYLYLKDDTTLEVLAYPGAMIEYAEAEIGKKLDDIKVWDPYDKEEGITIPAKNGKTLVIYARVTDRDGNVCYASTNGVVFDTIKPVIKIGGAVYISKKTFYTTQEVTVTDANLFEITLDDSTEKVKQTSTFKLPGDKNETQYEIIAVDKAGNSTKRWVETRTIASLKDPIKDLTTSNMKPENRAAVEEVLEFVTKQEGTEPEEKELKKIEDFCEDLLKNVTYTITNKTTELQWEKGSKKDLEIKLDGTYNKVTKLLIDKKEVDSKNYTTKTGSLSVKLEAEYLQTLSNTKHTIQLIFDDGETDGKDKIEIQKASTNPKTGDTGILFWMTASFVSLACLAVILPGKKRSFRA